MDIYLNALFILKEILKQSDHKGWEEWIAQDIEAWKSSKSTLHHKSAYGGMGSINDLYITPQTPEDCWRNTLLQDIKELCYQFSMTKSIDLSLPFRTAENQRLPGYVCTDCGYAETTALNLEHFLSEKLIPTFIEELLPGENHLTLLELQNMINSPRVTKHRSELESKMQKMHIAFNKTHMGGMRPCPKCKGNNTQVYYWKVN